MKMDLNGEQPMKPQQFAEHKLLITILRNTFPPGSALPNERDLSEQVGVTRPTLRETLQRLAREKWITIQQGKSTIVNDYWKEGGLGMLGTMAKYAEFLPDEFVPNLLDFRILLLPPCAKTAVESVPEKFLQHLAVAKELGDDAAAFTQFDWILQLLMVRNSKNMIYPLIQNDFSEIYQRLGIFYFRIAKARKSSGEFYRRLEREIQQNGKQVETIVRDVMQESREIWMELKAGMNISDKDELHE